jgi:hypothetical protein
MIPFTHSENLRDLSDRYKVYISEHLFTVNGTYDIFTHSDGRNRRFLPTDVSTFLYSSPSGSIGAAMTFGIAGSVYNEWSTSAALNPSVAPAWSVRTLTINTTKKFSLVNGDIMRSVFQYSSPSVTGPLYVRIYFGGLLI